MKPEEIKFSKEALEELKETLEKRLENRLYHMVTPGFRSDNKYDRTKIYQERVKIMKNLVEISSMYSIVLKILEKWKK